MNQDRGTAVEATVCSMSLQGTLSSVLQFLDQDTHGISALAQEGPGPDPTPTAQHSDPGSQSPPYGPGEQSPEPPSGDCGGHGQQPGTETGGKRGRREEQEEEADLSARGEEQEEEEPGRRQGVVSRSLMATLWARFKRGGCLSLPDSLALSFQFDVTTWQIHQWFCTQRKKYKKEMSRRKSSRRLRKCRKRFTSTIRSRRLGRN